MTVIFAAILIALLVMACTDTERYRQPPASPQFQKPADMGVVETPFQHGP